jgi:hypothetical protein
MHDRHTDLEMGEYLQKTAIKTYSGQHQSSQRLDKLQHRVLPTAYVCQHHSGSCSSRIGATILCIESRHHPRIHESQVRKLNTPHHQYHSQKCIVIGKFHHWMSFYRSVDFWKTPLPGNSNDFHFLYTCDAFAMAASPLIEGIRKQSHYNHTRVQLLDLAGMVPLSLTRLLRRDYPQGVLTYLVTLTS